LDETPITGKSIQYSLLNLRFQSYLGEEFFADLGEDEVNRNRVTMGMKASITRNLQADLFYLWQTSKSRSDWQDTNILGFYLRYDF
jgi:hypothetical protein